MDRGIDCVAITDHNSGEWIDRLKQALAQLEQQNQQGYRPLHLFPGVEISASGGVHILAIFDPQKTTGDINTLLGAVDYQGTKGASDAVTSESPTKVINLIVEHGGIAIPAHVDKEKGLFKSMQGASLDQVLCNPNIHAMELCDEDFPKPELYISRKTGWTAVRGSDFHGHDTQRTAVFTWIKFGSPSIEGLRLALIDGDTSVDREMGTQPNQHAEYVIERFDIKGARYMGRPDTLTCSFSPFLNTIIGGRGCGKSTLLEFMRLTLRQEKQLPERLKEDYQNYFCIDEEGGLLTQDSHLQLYYRKGETRYRLNWDENFGTPSLEEQQVETGDWYPVEGEITSLFPVSIYSQKQIFELASKPQGLLGIIDRAPEVGLDEYLGAFQACDNKCKHLYQQRVELMQKIAEETKLKGQLNDLARQIRQAKQKIAQVKQSGHEDLLQTYRLRQQQLREIEYVEQHWQELLGDLQRELVEIELTEVNEAVFAQHPEILSALLDRQEGWQQKIRQILEIVKKQLENLEHWRAEKAKQEWMKRLNQDLQQYEQLRTRLEKEKIDPKTYPVLLQRHTQAEKALQQITHYKQQIKQLRALYHKEYKNIKNHRAQLTERRTQFLERVLKGSQSVRITIDPFAERWVTVEKEIRKILHAGDRFDKDIEALKSVFDKAGWEQVKRRILAIRQGEATAKDKRFERHLRDLPGESMIDVWLWFPEDALKITYGPGNKKIQEGSPGQKSAALLAFIMAHGDEPLLLDQPEDDLDNDLIYSLIVQAIKSTKNSRQIIVVTHNANIVVNGDSEMVHCLKVANGQSHLTSDSLQSAAIRQRICDTMEGGNKAFEQRYRRIHLEH